MNTCVVGGDRPGRGPGCKTGRLTAGEDSSDEGVAVCDTLNRQWDRVRGAGMEGFSLPELCHRST